MLFEFLIFCISISLGAGGYLIITELNKGKYNCNSKTLLRLAAVVLILSGMLFAISIVAMMSNKLKKHWLENILAITSATAIVIGSIIHFESDKKGCGTASKYAPIIWGSGVVLFLPTVYKIYKNLTKNGHGESNVDELSLLESEE